jgi:hypothetical protein
MVLLATNANDPRFKPARVAAPGSRGGRAEREQISGGPREDVRASAAKASRNDPLTQHQAVEEEKLAPFQRVAARQQVHTAKFGRNWTPKLVPIPEFGLTRTIQASKLDTGSQPRPAAAVRERSFGFFQ